MGKNGELQEELWQRMENCRKMQWEEGLNAVGRINLQRKQKVRNNEQQRIIGKTEEITEATNSERNMIFYEKI